MAEAPQLSSSDSATPTPEQIRAQVDRMITSEVFFRAERCRRFLGFIVDRTLRGKADELKEYLIGVEVYQKGPDFDPRLDSAVRVDARRLRSKLAEYYAGPGAADDVRIHMPKGGYVPQFYLGGPVPAPPEEAEAEEWSRPSSSAG